MKKREAQSYKLHINYMFLKYVESKTKLYKEEEITMMMMMIFILGAFAGSITAFLSFGLCRMAKS